MSGNIEPLSNSIDDTKLLLSLPSTIEFNYKKLKSYNIQNKYKEIRLEICKGKAKCRSSTPDNSILYKIIEKVKKTKEEDNKNIIHNSSKIDKNIENYLINANKEFNDKEKKELEMIKNKTKRNYSSTGYESNYNGKKIKNSTLNDYFKVI